MEINTDSKTFDFKHYLVPRINKETSRKELKRLLEIGVLNTVQQSKYGTPIFIISKKEGTTRFM